MKCYRKSLYIFHAKTENSNMLKKNKTPDGAPGLTFAVQLNIIQQHMASANQMHC